MGDPFTEACGEQALAELCLRVLRKVGALVTRSLNALYGALLGRPASHLPATMPLDRLPDPIKISNPEDAPRFAVCHHDALWKT
jgi:hypothetical protein